MSAIDPVKVAHDLMLDAARNVTTRQIRNAIGDHDGSANLSNDDTAALIADVQYLIETAEITIDTGEAR